MQFWSAAFSIPASRIACWRAQARHCALSEAAMIPRILSALLLLCMASPSWAQSLDLLIRNGSVPDGSGSPAKEVDIGIRGDRVVFIGENLRQKAKRFIDAQPAHLYNPSSCQWGR